MAKENRDAAASKIRQHGGSIALRFVPEVTHIVTQAKLTSFREYSERPQNSLISDRCRRQILSLSDLEVILNKCGTPNVPGTPVWMNTINQSLDMESEEESEDKSVEESEDKSGQATDNKGPGKGASGRTKEWPEVTDFIGIPIASAIPITPPSHARETRVDPSNFSVSSHRAAKVPTTSSIMQQAQHNHDHIPLEGSHITCTGVGSIQCGEIEAQDSVVHYLQHS